MKRTVVVQLGNMSSVLHQFTVFLPKWSLPLLVVYNVYRSSEYDPECNGLSWVLILADDGHIYKTTRDTRGSQISAKKNWIAYPNGAQTSDFWSIQTDTNTVKHSWQQNRRLSDTSNHIWWSCDRTHKSSGLRIHFDWPIETRGNNNTEVQERPQSGDFFIFESVVHSVTDNGLGFTDKSPEAA